MLVYFVPFIVSNRYLLFWVSNGHNSVTVQNRTHVYMNFFDHKDLGSHLLQLCPKVVKHPVYYKKLFGQRERKVSHQVSKCGSATEQRVNRCVFVQINVTHSRFRKKKALLFTTHILTKLGAPSLFPHLWHLSQCGCQTLKHTQKSIFWLTFGLRL